MYFKRAFLFLLFLPLCFISSAAHASLPTWRFLWIILPRVNANHADNINYKFTLTQDEITKIREMSERVEQFIEEATNHAVDIEMTVVESTGIVKSLTDNNEHLFVGEDDFPSDIKKELKRASEEDRPYHIKVATFRLDGDNEKLNNWFGLGGGTYARVRFSKVSDFIESETNPHPEEVWTHEIIHCFESIFNDLGTMAGLHDNAKYGYENDNGWYKWYHDILAGKVKDTSTGKFVGIKADMWQHLPSRSIAYWKGHTYKIFDTVKTWSGAKSYCESLGGHLVTITSEEEQNVVATLLKQVATWNYIGYWMGAQKDSKWRWLTGEAFKYTKFSNGQPDGSGNYLQMYNYPDPGNWDDTTARANEEIQGNLYPHGIICEWEYAVTPSITILTTNHLPGGVINETYSQSLVADEKTLDWVLVSGTVPTGLMLNPSGLLNGIPTTTGSFDFTVKAEKDSEYDLKTFTLEITSASVSPVITTIDLKDANVNEDYYQKLEIKGSVATWKSIGANLPTNLVLSDSGEITGKPLVAGNYSFTVRAENSVGYNDKTFNLKIVNEPFPVTEMEEEEIEEQEEYNQPEQDQYQENNEQNNVDDYKEQENNTPIDNNKEQSENTQPNEQQNEQEVNNHQEQSNHTHENNSSGGGGCNTGMLSFLLFCLIFIKHARS